MEDEDRSSENGRGARLSKKGGPKGIGSHRETESKLEKFITKAYTLYELKRESDKRKLWRDE